MPITCRLIPEKKLRIMTHQGVVPDEELLSFYDALHKNYKIDPTFDILVDLQNTDSSVRSSEALQKLARNLREKSEIIDNFRPKIAVVAPGDVSFGMARMYDSFRRTVKQSYGVFRTVAAALEWLGLPESLEDVIYKNNLPLDLSGSD